MTGNGESVNLLKLICKNSSNHIRVFSKLIFGGFRSFGTTSNTYLLTKFLWLKHNFHFSAPTDVLEALNRVLDDNRELFIPETQTLIKAHTNFRLFATQNPTGSYGGRKPLSRAFRNRFVELHFDELPHQELSEIIEKRAGIARSQSVKLVDVLRELQMIRRESATFKGKYSFLTLRDLFRWAFRCSNFKVGILLFKKGLP